MNNKKIMFWIIVLGIIYIVVLGATMIMNKTKDAGSAVTDSAKQKSGTVQKKGRQAVPSLPIKADEAEQDDDLSSSSNEKGQFLQ